LRVEWLSVYVADSLVWCGSALALYQALRFYFIAWEGIVRKRERILDVIWYHHGVIAAGGKGDNATECSHYVRAELGPKTERTACRKTHRAVKTSSGAMAAPHRMQNPPRISVQDSHGQGQAWLLGQPGTRRAAVAIYFSLNLPVAKEEWCFLECHFLLLSRK